MPQPFRLQTILNLRKQERDHLSSVVVAARARLAACLDDQRRIAAHRQDLMDELRQLNDSASWNIDQVADRQAHLAHLRDELTFADRHVADAESEFRACLTQFMKAEQAFRGLERLAEKQAKAEAACFSRRTLMESDDAAMSRWFKPTPEPTG